jgi:hypothetical protein
MKGGSSLGIFDLIKGGKQARGGRHEPPVKKEERSYEQLIDEIMAWNIEHTDIVGILRKEIDEERLLKWSDALEKGVRKNLDPNFGKREDTLAYPIYLDLYQFVRGVRIRLSGSPAVKYLKPMERSDSLLVCILCGIRALQKEKGAKRPIDTLQWMVMERYLG